jgi:transcriptional regulator with XRE-family HTH domain
MPALNHERDNFVNTNVIENYHVITYVMTISERLRQARDKLGLTQEQLAAKANVAQGTIANIENGIRKKPREILSIARALNVQPDWLMSGKWQMETPPGLSPQKAEEPAGSWVVGDSKIVQALNVLEAALTKLDMSGRERLAPLFESFARSPGTVIKADIHTLLESQAAHKSPAAEKAALQKTG